MTPRSQIKRIAELAVYDRTTVLSILGAAFVAHVGIVMDDGTPVVIPMAYAVDGDHLLVHGSAASRLMRTKSPVCITVTVIDGLVVARSLFESSMNYRSVVVLATPQVIEGDDKRAALMTLSAALLPGRIGQAREPSDKEVRATTIWRVPLDEASAKVRTGPPVDDPADVDLPYWGGVIPLRTVAGVPMPDGVGQHVDMPAHIAAIADRFQ